MVRVWRRDHGKLAQKFCERIAKLPEFRHASRRKVMSALGQRALRKPCTVAEALSEVGHLFRSENARLSSRLREIRVKISRKSCKIFRNFDVPRAQNLLVSGSVRCAKRMTSPKLSTGSIVRSDPKKQARGVEITQILCENPAKKIATFPEYQRASRRSSLQKNILTSLQLLL